MSKTQLQTNNTRLASLIDELRGKAAGGGGSVETCTVTLDGESLGAECYIRFVSAIVNQNGKPQLYSYLNKEGQTTSLLKLTIPDVVCGTTIVLAADLHGQGSDAVPYVEISGTATLDAFNKLNSFFFTEMFAYTFTAPTVANENCTIIYAYEP